MNKKDRENTITEIIQNMETTLMDFQGSVKLLANKPKPIILIRLSDVPFWELRKLSHDLFMEIYNLVNIANNNFIPGFRSVDLNRLEYVLDHGCDVDPTNSAMYVAEFEKALEYGGSTKVVQIFDYNQLKQSFLQVDANTNDQDLEKFKLEYPTIEHSIDGKKIWLSRLSEDAPQRATDYEIAYGKFIPGIPIDALLGLIIMVNNDFDVASVESTINQSTKIMWTL